MDTQLRKEILGFLTPLPALQSEDGRRARLYAAGLDDVRHQIDLGGSPDNSVIAIVEALEQYGDVRDEPALVVFLREIAGQVGADKQAAIQQFCERIRASFDTETVVPAQALLPIHPPETHRDVFLCYAREDLTRTQHIYTDLERAGLSPWLDTEALLGGQKWELIIQQAMRDCSYVLILLSRCSVAKRGFVQYEIKHALKLAEEFPSSAIYIIPIRLEECDPPVELKGLQWVDMFPDHQAGFHKLLKILAPEGREALLQRKIQLLTEEFQRLRREKGQDTEIAAVQEQRQQAETRLQEIHETPPKPAPNVVWRTARNGNVIPLRSEPLTVSYDEVMTVFGLNENQRPLEYIHNHYEDRREVVFDAATGLMWQKAGSDNIMLFRKAQAYIDGLNTQQFAGFNNWRLPTIPELMSLLEPERSSNGLYIDPVFDATQLWCWSADEVAGSPESVWGVGFFIGYVHRDVVGYPSYVRAVRS